MQKSDTVKLLGVAAMFLGFGLNMFTSWVDDKAIKEQIQQGIDEEFARRNSEGES